MTKNTVSTEPEQPLAPATASLGFISSRPLQGVLLLVAATFLFACNDTASKFLLTDYNVPLVQAIRYIVHTLLMLAILAPTRSREIVQTTRTRLVILRGFCLVVASFFFGLALQRMPVAETVSIVYLSPILVVLLARPLLGETIGWVGWMAAVIGFAGVLLIVRPGGGLDPIGVSFVLCNVVVTVAYYLLSRVLARTERTLALSRLPRQLAARPRAGVHDGLHLPRGRFLALSRQARRRRSLPRLRRSDFRISARSGHR